MFAIVYDEDHNGYVLKTKPNPQVSAKKSWNCPESVKELAYKSLGRPHVEYASQVWDPWMDKHIKQIEAVQRRSARFVKNY